ncbi:hypothetical protein V8D89_012163 [Ganoderma adspersum]
MAPSTPDRHTFLPSASPNKCAKCARGKGSPYHINLATTFSWTPPTFTPPSPPAPDVFSDVPDCFDPLHDDPNSDLESDASDDEGVPAHILAEFEETTRILDDLREYADQAFKALPNPAFTHPLRYAMHLMKVGFTHLRAPPDPAPSSPPPPTPPARTLSTKEWLRELAAMPAPPPGYFTLNLPARVLADASTRTAPPPPPPPARVLMDAAVQTPRPQHAECGTQATPAPPPTPPARVLSDAATSTPPARVFSDAATSTPPARVLSDAATSTPVRTALAPAPSPPPNPARTPTRSTSPPPRSPSTHEDFEKVLARLTALRKEVSPPPSPPPTPRATSPTPRAASEAAHLHLTIAVPHSIHSLTLDLVEQVPVPANNLYGEFSARPATANARAHRGRSRGRPVASPVRRCQHSS